MSRRAAILRITPELLLSALHLPADVKLCSASLDCRDYRLELVIEHESIPETEEGFIIPNVRADLITHYEEGQPPRVEFKGFA